jgi:hypothetical protein
VTMRAFVHAAAGWEAEAGPPQAELLPRAERLAASFSTRILAHVLGGVAERSRVPLSDVPWVLGSASSHAPGPELRRTLQPSRGVALVHAGPATVAMALVEALGRLVEHEAVLVAFVQDATPPHHEALAAALLLSRAPAEAGRLVLEAPVLRRTPSHSGHSGCSGRSESSHPLAAARALVRAVLVGRPTMETVPSSDADRPEHWRIELSLAD